jgi:hypothetical protein
MSFRTWALECERHAHLLCAEMAMRVLSCACEASWKLSPLMEGNSIEDMCDAI